MACAYEDVHVHVYRHLHWHTTVNVYRLSTAADCLLTAYRLPVYGLQEHGNPRVLGRSLAHQHRLRLHHNRLVLCLVFFIANQLVALSKLISLSLRDL